MSSRRAEIDPLVVFGRTVREIRLAKGLRQLEVAERADVHVNYVSEVENGHRNISLTNILWFASALDVEPSELLRTLRRSELRRLPRKSPARLRPQREK